MLGEGIGIFALRRLEDAEKRFRRAVEIRPSLGEAWMNLVDAGGKDVADADIAVLRERSEDSRLAEEDRIAFLFALGSAEDAKGNHSAAFEAYRKGNERRHRLAETAGTAFDADDFSEEISSVINSINKEVLSELEGVGDAEAEMIFICVGTPRSAKKEAWKRPIDVHRLFAKPGGLSHTDAPSVNRIDVNCCSSRKSDARKRPTNHFVPAGTCSSCIGCAPPCATWSTAAARASTSTA